MYVGRVEFVFKRVIAFNHELHKLKTGAKIKTILPDTEEASIRLLCGVPLKHTHTHTP